MSDNLLFFAVEVPISEEADGIKNNSDEDNAGKYDNDNDECLERRAFVLARFEEVIIDVHPLVRYLDGACRADEVAGCSAGICVVDEGERVRKHLCRDFHSETVCVDELGEWRDSDVWIVRIEGGEVDSVVDGEEREIGIGECLVHLVEERIVRE